MKYFRQTFLIVSVLLTTSLGCSKKPTQDHMFFAPVDHPESEPIEKYAPAIKPVSIQPKPDPELQSAIDKARKTLPTAKKRFTDGFSPGHILFVTTQLYDDANNKEQVFIKVTSWEKSEVCGKLSSNPQHLKGYRIGQDIIVHENKIIDWTISLPNGSEEGNFVGRYLTGKTAK